MATCRVTRRDELIQRVEGQALNSGRAVHTIAPDALEHTGHHAIGAVVAVVMRKIEKLAALVNEPVVAAPGVHADARHLFSGQAVQAGLDAVTDTVHVPVQ